MAHGVPPEALVALTAYDVNTDWNQVSDLTRGNRSRTMHDTDELDWELRKRPSRTLWTIR